MAELNKAALTSENNNSFPNNNTGFITPGLLRTFNGNMIDSLVDEINYNLDSASFNQRILTSSGAFTGSLLTTASAAGEIITFTKGDGSTFPISVSATSASFAFTSSVTQQVSTSISSQNLQHNVLFVDTTGPGFVQVDGGLRYNPNTNLLTTTASLALTASFAENVGDNYATTGSNTFIGNQIISGNLLVTGSNINLEVDPPALSVGTTNVKTIADSTASGVPSTLDITRLGAGPTGDLSGIRIQTLSGSDTTGDTLLSRVTTGVNRHTSTGMTGSVVNTQLVATWATGSSGTRVAYTSQLNANAQSASATLTLAAGNLNSNNAGGTASLSAGFIRIGAAQAHRVEVTGSVRIVGNTNISGSLNVSSSLTGDDGNLIRGGVTIVGGTNGVAVAIPSGSFQLTTPQGSGSFYSNCPITSSGLRINGVALVNDLIISGVFSGNSTLQVTGNASVTGALNVIGGASFSGSVYGEVKNVTVASNTASVDLTLSNFWQLQLTGSTTTFLNIQPVRPGQTVNIKVNTTGSGNVQFPSYVKQASGSAYIASIDTGVDILTFVSFDNSNIYLASIKNLI